MSNISKDKIDSLISRYTRKTGNPDTPEARAVLEFFLEFYRSPQKRLQDGLTRKLRSGDIAGNIRYGYRATVGGNTPGKLVPDEDESKAVRYIMDRHEEGMTLKQISSGLNVAGFRTRRGTEWRYQYVGARLKRLAEDAARETGEFMDASTSPVICSEECQL